jgi:hypothetical protein
LDQQADIDELTIIVFDCLYIDNQFYADLHDLGDVRARFTLSHSRYRSRADPYMRLIADQRGWLRFLRCQR